MTAKKKPEDLKKNQKPKTVKLASATKSEEQQKEEPKKKSNIVERPTVEFLPVALTDDEITAFAKESARLHGDKEGLLQEKKSVMSDFKSREGALDTRIAELNRKISGGTENRQVQCFWRIDYDANKKTLYRTPSSPAEEPGEVTSYNLSPAERQMQLPIGETKDDKAVKADAPLTATIAEALKANPAVIPAPGDSTGTDELRTPAAESAEETKIRKQFNTCDIEGRKQVFGVEELSDDRTKLPYKRLPEVDREIIRKFYRSQTTEVQEIPF